MKVILLALLVIGPALFIPSFAQSETITGLELHPDEQNRESTYIKQQDGYTWELDEDGILFKNWDADRLVKIPSVPVKYPQLTEDSGMVQVVQETGKTVFDKSTCAVSIFDRTGIVIDSDSYVIRTAESESDTWTSLSVNQSACAVSATDGDVVSISMTRENSEGIFTVTYDMTDKSTKTTATFQNDFYPNHKFAVTETLQVIDEIFVNGMPVNLDDFVGVTFDRATLEQNNDLVIQVGELYYNSGIGFDQLWSVGIYDNNMVSLDYAKQNKTIPIGDVYTLDPHISGSPPDPPTSLTAVQTVANQADLSWTPGASNGDYYVSNKATTYANDIDAPNSWMLFPGATPGTAPTLGASYGKIGNGASFNGISNSIGDPLIHSDYAVNNSNVTYTEATVSAWIKPTATSASAGVPFSMVNFGHYWIQNGQWSAFYPPQSFNVGGLYSGGNMYTQNTWHHIVWTMDDSGNSGNGEQLVYLDGSLVTMCTYPGCQSGTGNSAGSATTDPQGKTASLILESTFLGGHNHYNSSANYPFEGNIDEFSSWNKVMTASEVTALYNGTPHDAINVAGGLTDDNLINYLPFNETSFKIENWAQQTDPTVMTYNVIRDGSQITSGVSGTTYNDTGVSHVNSYNYNVTATTSNGTSSNSNTANVTINGLPDQVTGVTAQDGVPIILNWTAPNDNGSAITNYEIHRDGALLTTVGNVLTYSDNSVVGGTSYTFQIGAVNSLGTGPLSAGVSALAGVPPDPPTSLSSSIPNNPTAPLDIVLTWTLPGNPGTASLSDIKIERSTNNTTWTPLTTLFTGSGSSVSFTDQVGTPGQYYYRVYAVSPHGTSIASNDTNSTTSDVPDAPVLSGTIINDTQIDLEWTTPNSSSDLINYRLTQNGVDILQPSVGTNSHSVTGLTPGGTYDFIIYAKNYAGDSTGSNTIQLTTYITPTGTLTATVNQIGATLEIVPSFTLTGGTPVPSFTNISLYEGGVLKKTAPYGTFYYHLPDGSATALELRINDSSHWYNPTFVYTFTATSTYIPNWDSNNVSHDITRANNLFNIIVNWDTTIPFDMTCEYKTSQQAIDKTAGITSTGTGLWAFQDSGVAINDGTHVYGECTSNNQTILTFTSYGPNLILAGAGLLNQHSGDFLGVPAVMIFIIAVAGLFTGRSANTGILVILSVIGIAGFLGFMIIDQATWGFILIAGVLGLFVGRRFL